MRIVITTENFLPSIGGVEFHTEILATALKDLNVDITIYCFRQYESVHSIDNIKIVYHTSNKELIRVFKDADLIISNGELSIKAVLWSWLLQKKVVCFYHMALPFIKNGGEKFNRIKNTLRKILVHYPIQHIGVSQAVLDEIVIPIENKQRVIYNPIRQEALNAIEEVKPDAENEKYDILFCGRLIEGKGLLILAEALIILSKKKRNISVLIVGEGSELESFKSKTNGLDTITITYLPFLNIEALVDYYKKSKILILPSYKHKEGSPFTLIEFLFLGKPVIISDQPAMMETCGTAALVAQQGSHLSLVDCMDELLCNSELYDQLKGNAQHESLKFSPIYFKEELAKLLFDINNLGK